MNFRLIRCGLCIAITGVALDLQAGAQSCAADVNGDGFVDGKDLAMVLSAWGTCPVVVESVAPLHGSHLGGTQVTIIGSGLSTVSAVTVGGALCTDVIVMSPRQIRATTPPGQPGSAVLVVTAAGGSEAAPSEYAYVEQQVTSVVPNSGAYTGGTAITLTGQFLAGTTGVTVGGVPCTNVVSLGAGQVTANTPAGSVGAVDVVVSGPKGSVVVPRGFTYTSVTVPSWATLVEAEPDPSIVVKPELRSAIIDTGYPWRIRDNAAQIEMVLIPPGTFSMGCSPSTAVACRPDESPVHQVTLTKPFYMSRYEVTRGQWAAILGGTTTTPNHPQNVSWDSAQIFLSQTGMRLPTEAEWEYAYRAGTNTAFHSMPGYPDGTNDDTMLGAIAWYSLNSQNQPHPVGQKAGNGFGLHDMSGNVGEWCNDWYGSTYYASSPAVDPIGPPPIGNRYRVDRGGAWKFGSALDCRSSARGYFPPSNTPDNGIRAVRLP